MSSQRYSLSEELAHIVCSKRHLPALLSVMAGTVCPLCHQNKAQANTLAACIWLGAAGNSPHLLGGSGLALQPEAQAWNPRGSPQPNLLKDISCSGQQSPRHLDTPTLSLIPDWQRKRQNKEHRGLFKMVYSLG